MDFDTLRRIAVLLAPLGATICLGLIFLFFLGFYIYNYLLRI